MSKKLLNIGCGSIYNPGWINIDMVSCSPGIRSHDIRKSLPFRNSMFDACYSSHLLEHLTKDDAQSLLVECFRVLKPKGIIRIVVPDLEGIVKNYLQTLNNMEAVEAEAFPNYDWMMLELYDQSVRTFSGGEMARYLKNSDIPNKEFVLSRIGKEAENLLDGAGRLTEKSFFKKIKSQKFSRLIRIMNRKIRNSVSKILVRIISGKEALHAFEEGLFRNSGEIHRWMYDRFSLRRLLELSGFIDVRICTADQSQIPNFDNYQLDTIDGKVRKPDSLFMEGRKP